jgi:MoxR-like ATPase
MPTTATAPAKADVSSIVDKFKAILDFQDARIINRRHELFIVMTSFVAKVHVVLHGPPGNGKTMTADGIVSHFPALRIAKTQAYKASTPEQFLGPISFKAMENDEYRRITKGKFADCDVYLCDELPRAPKPVLTAFQGGMVEREFDNGNGPEKIDLRTLIGTSNHLPDDEELQAFFDRFCFKLVIEAPQSQDDIVAILDGAIERRAGRQSLDPPPELLVELAELDALSAAANQVIVPVEFKLAVADLYANLIGSGLTFSPRRLADFVGGCQAAALLDGRDEVMQDDILLADDSLWSVEDEREIVHEEVVKFASEWQRDKAGLIDSYDELKDKLIKIQSKTAQLVGGTVPREITNEGIDIINEQANLQPLVQKQIANAAGRDTAALDQILTEMDKAKQYVQDRLLGGLEL